MKKLNNNNINYNLLMMKKKLPFCLAMVAIFTIISKTTSAQVKNNPVTRSYSNNVIIVNPDNDSEGWGQGLRFGGASSGERIASNRLAHEWGGPKWGFTFWTAGIIRMVIDSTGHIGIGTKGGESLSAMLTVNGNTSVNGELKVKNIIMSANPKCWPDYVFAKNYKLMNLSDLENFINTNHHLPNFPSVKAIESNQNSYDVNEMNAGLLKTVEEQTLYIIKLNKEFNSRLDEQNKKISELEAKLNYATN
ncbi:MAG: hypothetical protein ACQPRI_05675 [Solitalea-like symbiont of Tyrophagus putrescentiae]